MHCRVVAGHPQRDRVGMAAHDRGIAAVSLRGGSGSRALPPVSPGRSAAKVTSRSGLPRDRAQAAPTARLNGSVGASFAGDLVLMFGTDAQSRVMRVGIHLYCASRVVNRGPRS